MSYDKDQNVFIGSVKEKFENYLSVGIPADKMPPPKKGWINLIVAKSKAGRWYVKSDDWTPQPRQEQDWTPQPLQEQENELPF